VNQNEKIFSKDKESVTGENKGKVKQRDQETLRTCRIEKDQETREADNNICQFKNSQNKNCNSEAARADETKGNQDEGNDTEESDREKIVKESRNKEKEMMKIKEIAGMGSENPYAHEDL
jgi:hypothetical protein